MMRQSLPGKRTCAQKTLVIFPPRLKSLRRLAVLRPISCCLTLCFPKLFGIGNSLQIPVIISMIYILGRSCDMLTPQQITQMNPNTSYFFLFQELLTSLFQLHVYGRRSLSTGLDLQQKGEYLISDHDLYLQSVIIIAPCRTLLSKCHLGPSIFAGTLNTRPLFSLLSLQHCFIDFSIPILQTSPPASLHTNLLQGKVFIIFLCQR